MAHRWDCVRWLIGGIKLLGTISVHHLDLFCFSGSGAIRRLSETLFSFAQDDYTLTRIPHVNCVFDQTNAQDNAADSGRIRFVHSIIWLAIVGEARRTRQGCRTPAFSGSCYFQHTDGFGERERDASNDEVGYTISFEDFKISVFRMSR